MSLMTAIEVGRFRTDRPAEEGWRCWWELGESANRRSRPARSRTGGKDVLFASTGPRRLWLRLLGRRRSGVEIATGRQRTRAIRQTL